MYEMLTGRLPFEGETATDTLARIIERQPDWEVLPQEIPTNIRTLLRRCLEKDPRRRLRDIGDIAITLEETTTELHSPTLRMGPVEAGRAHIALVHHRRGRDHSGVPCIHHSVKIGQAH
jgi:serine/threonine protein kinase